MSEEQLKLWIELMELFKAEARPKFESGTIEHPGRITDMTYEQLEQAELEEIIDLVHYRMTKILKRKLESKQVLDHQSQIS